MLHNALKLRMTVLLVMVDRVRFASFIANRCCAVLLSTVFTYQGCLQCASRTEDFSVCQIMLLSCTVNAHDIQSPSWHKRVVSMLMISLAAIEQWNKTEPLQVSHKQCRVTWNALHLAIVHAHPWKLLNSSRKDLNLSSTCRMASIGPSFICHTNV